MKLKSKKIIVLILFLIVLFLIPIFLLATKAILSIPKMDDASIAEANKKESERVFAEKEKFAQEHKNEAGTSIDIPQVVSSTEDDDTIIKEEARKVNEKFTKTINVIEKYYPTEYHDITIKLEKELEDNKDKAIDLKNTPLTETQKSLYYLIIKIIDNKELSNDELYLLKDFLINNKIEIDNDSELKEKVDKILK